MTKALVVDAIAHGVIEGSASKPTLAPLSKRFEPGRLHVVGGPSGSGKTTLLSILALVVRPTRGAISWGTQILTDLPAARATAWRRENLGIVFQTSRLVSVMTVAEHIRLAATIRRMPCANAKGHAILGAFGMRDRLDHRPVELSGGEKQRLALAQALCATPAILIADEPTAALDQTNAEQVAAALRSYARDHHAVVICVSHDRAVIDVADDLTLLERP